LLPGANLFIAQEDLSRPSTPSHPNAIHCTRIDAEHSARIAAKGWNYLRRILYGVSEL
jgi:hypothetical protein